MSKNEPASGSDSEAASKAESTPDSEGTSERASDDGAAVDRAPRLRRLAIAIVLLVAVLIAGRQLLPIAIEAGLSAWATRALDAPVSIGRVELALWRGEAVVESLRVGPIVRRTTLEVDPEPEGLDPLRDTDVPGPSEVTAADTAGDTASPADAAAPTDAPDDPAPLLTLARLEVEIDWSALLDRRIRLARIELDEPALRIRRTVEHGLNVAALGGRDDAPIDSEAVPTDGEATPAGSDAVPTDGDAVPTDGVAVRRRRDEERPRAPSADERSWWPIAIDRFVLRDGRLLARDHAVERSHAVEIELDEIRIDGFTTDGDGPPAPTRVVVDGSIADAPLRADVEVVRGEAGLDLVGTVEVERLPLAQGRAHLSRVGWRGLAGEMDLALELREARSEGHAWAVRLKLRDARVEGVTSGDAPPLVVAVDRLRIDAELEAPWAAAIESDADPNDLQLTGRVDAQGLRAEQASIFRLATRSLTGELDRLRWTRAPAGDDDADQEGEDGAASAREARTRSENEAHTRSENEPRTRSEDQPRTRSENQPHTRSENKARPASPVAPPVVEIGIARIDLDEPEVRLTRAVEGHILAPSFGGPGAADATDVEDATGDDRAPGDRVPTEVPAEVPTTVAWQVDRVSVRRGAIRLTDRTVEPFAVVEARDVDGTLEAFAWPEGRIERIALRGDMGGDEPVELSGRMSLPTLDATLRGSRVPLGPLNPYVSAFTGYVADTGQASVETDLSAGARGYRADNRLVLHDLGFSGSQGESVFRKRFGLPLSLAMALLRDVRGDVALDFVFEGEHGAQAGVSLGGVVSSALQSAVVGALASPLKLVGSVVMRGGQIERFEPEPLACAPGETELAPASQAALDRLARALSAHPALAVRLEGESTPADVDALVERAPAAPLETLVDDAGLREEAREEPREEALAEARHAAAELARERARAVCRRLIEDYGVPRERIQLAWADAPRADALPGIDVTLAARSALPEEEEACTVSSEG